MSDEIIINGPDDAELRIFQYKEFYLWKVRNGSLRQFKNLQLEVRRVQSYDSNKLAFREPIRFTFALQLGRLAAGDETKAQIFMRFEDDQLGFGNSKGMDLISWPGGDPSLIRRWLFGLRIVGLSQEWPIELDVQWTRGTTRLDFIQNEAQTEAPTVAPRAIHDPSKTPEPSAVQLATPETAPSRNPPRRTPDLELSRERLALFETLARELAIVKQETRGHCTVAKLKGKYPNFALWTVIEDSQIKELAEGEAFTPKAYAENLVLAKYGLSSRETLKKDRRKLRKAK